ncbi:class I glutamine amidotransferase-like protein [Dipodascopsis uninucleata]
MTESVSIGLLLFPKLTQLDFTGPFEVFSRVKDASVHVIAKSMEPVTSDTGLRILPTVTYKDCPKIDVICVPGGPGQIDLMDDDETLDFLRKVAEGAKLITSVCTGSLVLAAAGLMKGYRATCHWSSIDQLELLGAIPTDERVVHDRNRVTGAGITSGIDFALTLVSDIRGPDAAKAIQLQLEYDPAPPYDYGSPKVAPKEFVDAARRRMAQFISKRRAATEKAASRLL